MLTRVCFLTISKTVSVNTVRNITGMSKFDLPNRLKGNEKSVWVEYIQLALQYKPLNLGQGFPDYYAPENVTNALATVAKSDNPLLQQYTRGFGHPRLVNAIAKFYSKLINRDLDPNKEVLVTAGAYEALYSSLQGHTNLGDEWIVIEPFFDCYVPMIQTAGGIPRFIALKPKSTSGTVTSGDWVFDRKEMEGLFNEKTKGIVINTPHNPIGKIFTLDELQFIADLAKKWNVLVISDEVYEHIVYEPYKHIRMANLLHNLQVVHQNSVYTCTTPTQEAVAIGFELEMERLEQPDCYFRSLAMELLPKRDYMAKFLQEVGMVPTIPEGGYFMLANWSALENKVKLNEETDASKDYRFTKWMTKNVGLQGIPPTAFYGPEHKTLAEDYVRYCFIKKDENLKAAAKILKKWVSQ
ncbi:Kynurenine--oxoglutarate transaminase 3 [Acromyrmex echinatior]|uniref:Kynurenine--oxoglutarate transaminase 3 n=1 Tax=Acromyrmex echinatior TaxID=103372 RepID=F4WVL1_ACREC|nr:Kynurenine--oxoglutarate transaminase 3 [Acromyrmex echinatior]